MIEVKKALAGHWMVCSDGHPMLHFSDDELDQLAQALTFRLEPRGVASGPTGVELRVGTFARVHLCYSDDADAFTAAVMKAAGENGVTV